MNEDADLLRDYASNRSEGAFAALVARHLNLVYCAAVRQLAGDEHRARDVTQQVFLLCARKASALAGHANLTGWLYTTTYRVSSEVRRAERRRRLHEERLFTMSSPVERDSLPVVDWERVKPTLDAAMHELSSRDRDALLLRFFEKRSFADLGRTLEVTEDAARMRVDRSLEKLRLVLARRGVTSTTAAMALGLAREAALGAPLGLSTAVVTGVLADTGIISGTGITLFKIMSTSKVMVGTASLVALVAVGVAWHERNAAEQAGAEALLAVKGQESLRRQLRQTERSAPALLPEAPAIEPVAAPPAAGPGNLGSESVPNPELELVKLADFRNVGRATPGAAYQTFIWAVVNGKSRILEDSFDIPAPARKKLDEAWASLNEEERIVAGRPERLIGLAIGAEMPRNGRMQVLGASADLPDNEVLKARAQRAAETYASKAQAGMLTNLGVRIETVRPDPDDGSTTSDMTYQMWQDEGEWRLVVHPEMVPPVNRIRRVLQAPGR